MGKAMKAALPLVALSLAIGVGGAPAQAASDQAIAEQFVRIAKVAIRQFREELKDSESARIRKAYFRVTAGVDGQDHFTLCGEVNARNSFGAYGGWEPFYATEKEMVLGSRLVIYVCDPAADGWLRQQDFAEILQKEVRAN